MPLILNPAALDDFKPEKRMLKNWQKTFLEDKGFGATVPVSANVDTLMAICEKIETDAELITASYDQFLIERRFQGKHDIKGDTIYRTIRAGLKVVTSFNFGRIPKTDAVNLEAYASSLEQYYGIISDRQDKITQSIIDNAAQPDFVNQLEADIVSRWTALILPNLKVFIDTLRDGLLIFNSGQSGQVNKRGSTYKTSAIENIYERDATGNIVPKAFALGAGKYLGTDYIPTRYL